MSDDDQSSTNPFESTDPELDPSQVIENEEDKLPEGTPDVASKAGKTFIILGMVGALILFLLYTIFSGKDESTAKPEPIVRTVDSKPIEPPPLPVEAPPLATPLPTIVPPTLPAGPVNLPEPVNLPVMGQLNPAGVISPEDDAAAKTQAQARMRSNMLVKSGSSSKSALGALTGGGKGSEGNDANSLFANSLAATSVETVKATRIGDMNRTIAQGRIIQATLETAINTDLSAPIRAIVSRDTYGEAGRVPLIPKGSRLIGRYNSTLTTGQTRVFVVWTRIIRPDGVDIMVNSPLVDAIGQAGVAGQIDTKFQQIFARAFVSSVMNIGLAIGADEINGGGTTATTTTPEGNSQTTGDPVSEATSSALDKLGSVTDNFIQRFINVPATILVDQGTPVNVFVNKDLLFPGDLAGMRVIE